MRLTGFEGKAAIVTGAAGGIGRATARLCAALGAELVLTDRAAASDLMDGLETGGRSHRFLACDVTSRSDIDALCAAAGPIDCAVLNAGIFPTSAWSEERWEDDFDAVMTVNVRAPAQFARALLPGMKARGQERIVLMGSVAAHTGGSYAHSPLPYAASKGAVHTMVRWLAKRAAPEVLVNGVAPGSVRTAMTASADPNALKAMPVPRFGEPEEVAWPIAFLCSPGASFLCGATLDVNGGAYMH